MSEFFKALEQAERDRLRENEDGDRNATAPATAPRPSGGPAADTTAPPSQPASPKPSVSAKAAKPAPPPKVDRTPRAPEPVQTAAVSPATTPPTTTPPVTTPPVTTPPSDASSLTSVVHAPPPETVFRPALRTRDGVRRRAGVRRDQPWLIAQSEPSSLEAEAYRTVRAKIELMAVDGAYRRIAVTSVSKGDGKSTSAANLAIVAAQAGRRVCLVDADLRRPTLHEVFGLANIEGLASALADGKPLHTVAKASSIANLSVVVAGRGAEETFRDLMTSQRLDKVTEPTEVFDLVIFDTPPVISVSDTLSVAAVCDGMILVVQAGTVPFSVLRRAVEQIGQVKGRVLGVLLNRVHLRASDAEFYRYYRRYHAKPTV